MVKHDAAFLRNTRLTGIRKKIATEISVSTSKKVNLEKLVTWVQINYGLTEKRANEYIQLIARAVGWSIDEGEGVLIADGEE